MVRRREPVVHYGPGFHRMKARLGPEAMEAMRRDVIERQLAARSMISGERVTERDRDTYVEYPPPKTKSKRRKK